MNLIQVAILLSVSTNQSRNRRMITSEEQLLGCLEEFVLGFGVGYWIEPPDAHNLPDGVTTSVVCKRVRPKNAAQICFQP
jgi:hypothetical protein